MEKEEIWKDVVEWEGKYQVSNLGRVRKNTGRILTASATRWGYFVVGLKVKTDKSRVFRIHRLVALAFIPNPEMKATVNHIDGNKLNNCVTNLEWATQRENVQHAQVLGLRYNSRNIPRPYYRKSIEQFDKSGNLVAVHESIAAAAASVGTARANISQAARGTTKTCQQYIWRYAKTA
jgi:hypothetical protein